VPLGFLVAAVLAFALSDVVRFVVISIAAATLYGNPSEADRQEAQNLRDTITSAHHFVENSVVAPDQPPVFCGPASRGLLFQPATCEIYDVRNHTEQDEIIDAVKAAVTSSKLKAVDLQFLDHENWITTPKSGQRGPETRLRRVHITSGGIRDDPRQKLITYRHP
jgi:hypothetical protein